MNRGNGANADAAAGLLFVVLWSSGYIAAAFALHGMGSFTLAVLRFFCSAFLIGLWVLFLRLPRPAPRALAHAAAGGVLLQAGFFGFAYAGMRAGVPAAAAGLICGLMPLTTALGGAALLGEPLRRAALLGFVLGLAGVLLVVAPQLRAPGSALGYLFMTLALAALSLGTLYQKRFPTNLDPRLTLVVQLMASMLLLLPLAWHFEQLQLHYSNGAVLGVLWAILVNSCAGLLLYLVLLSRGAAGRVASLFYLVPPVTALMAALVLQSQFGVRECAGFALAAAGVWLGQRNG